jgi:hypothetical protein
MLPEQTRDRLVDSITGLVLNYSGYIFSGQHIRSHTDLEAGDFFIGYSFLSTSKKIGESINYFMSKRSNTRYTNFGHGEGTQCYIRVFSIESGTKDGRELSQGWMQLIERYIKREWNSLITSGSVDFYQFGHAELQNPFNDHQYGNELNFTIWTTNSWTDEPDEGAISDIPISGVEISSGNIGRVWVTI